jgi:hypothetical protein
VAVSDVTESGSDRRFDVGQPEIVVLEQERHGFEPGRRIGDAVAEVQRGGMPALAIAQERLAGDCGAVGGRERSQ